MFMFLSGLVWSSAWIVYLCLHWRRHDRRLLRLRQRPFCKHRGHLGGRLRHHRLHHHLDHGRCASPREQAPGQVARQAGPSPGCQSGRRHKCHRPRALQEVGREIRHVPLAVHHCPARRARGRRLHWRSQSRPAGHRVSARRDLRIGCRLRRWLYPLPVRVLFSSSNQLPSNAC